VPIPRHPAPAPVAVGLAWGRRQPWGVSVDGGASWRVCLPVRDGSGLAGGYPTSPQPGPPRRAL